MSVEVSNSQVIIKSHSTSDVAIVAEFKSAVEAGKDPEAFLESLIGLGAQVVALGSNTASAEKIDASIGQARKVIQEVASNFEAAIKKQVNEFVAEDGSLVRSFNDIIDSFRDEIDEMTAGEESPLRTAMLKSLKEAQDKIQTDIARQVSQQKQDLAGLLDPADPTSPLRSLAEKMDQLGVAIAKVRDAQTKEIAVAEYAESGVEGGREYEDEVMHIAQRIAAAAGDDCELTGNVTGRLSKKKMGDGVAHLKVGSVVLARLVLEAKNKPLSKLDWERECKGSKENRAATGFVGLCKHIEDMPNGNRLFIMTPQEIVLAFNPETDDLNFLFMTYHIVRLNCLSSTGQIDEVNIVEVNQNLSEAVKALERFDAITKQASAIKNSADKITEEAVAMRNTVNDRLKAAQTAMSSRLTEVALTAAETLALAEGDAGATQKETE
jgi:hypothetical protein